MMRDAWRIGYLFGIPLRIHVSWLIVFGLVSWSLAAGYFPAQLPDLPVWSYWAKAIIAAVMFFVSLILHELGHSLVARWRGVGIAGITLFVFGGARAHRPRLAPALRGWLRRPVAGADRPVHRTGWCQRRHASLAAPGPGRPPRS
jgi:Zn-dependent protease